MTIEQKLKMALAYKGISQGGIGADSRSAGRCMEG